MSKRRKLLVNIILITILVLLVLVSTLLYINLYPRVSLHLISDDALYDTLQIKKNSSVPALKKPEKEGYTFIGWYVDQECTEPFQYNEAIENDMELYAKYEAIDYTLTFNCILDGTLYSNIYSSQIKHVGDHIWTPDGTETVLINGTEKTLQDLLEGYTFIGWSTTPNSISVACGAGGDILMPASNLNLYATWEPNLYTVSYFVQDLSDEANVVVDANGFVKYDYSNQKLYSSEAYKYSYKMESPASPVHEKGYYTFVGWYLDENFTRPINFDQVYMGLNQLANSNMSPIYNVDNSAPIILYAKWQVVEFDVLYCLNQESRPGSVYKIVDSSIMANSNGSVLNSDYFKAKSGYYFKTKMRNVDDGMYGRALLDGNVYYTSDPSVVSHEFLGWYTTKNGGKEYNNETLFNPEDFDRYYTSADAGFEFLRSGVRTYILYANWEEFYHIKYVYNNKTYDTQPVSANSSGELRNVMTGIKRDGYYFDGWSRTQSNTDSTVYTTGTVYRFITDASMLGFDTIYFGTNRLITLYPHWSPNEYHIKYDFSINTLSDNKIVCIENDPQNIVYSEYLKQNLLQNPDPIVRYNYQEGGQWESHVVYNSMTADGQSNAKYISGDTVYLLCGWAVVDADGNVLATYKDGEYLSASTKSTDIYKYSVKQTNKVDDGTYIFTIKALWKTQITISFDKNYDDVEGNVPDKIETITGNSITIPSSPNPTRPYHIFKGWVTAENRTNIDGSENYNPSTRYVGRNTVTFGEDTVLYASWEPIVYTLNIYNTNSNGTRGALLKQIKMTYADYSANVGSVILGSTIEFGSNAISVNIPKGYAMDGYSLTPGGDVVLGVGTILHVWSTYSIEGGDTPNEQNLFDSSKSSSVSIFVKYSLKVYNVEVKVVDPNGAQYGDSIVVENVSHGTVVGDKNGFIATNKIIAQISLPEGVTYDYWTISGVAGEISDITKCYQTIEDDLTITLYTKVETFDVSLVITDPLKNTTLTSRNYNDVAYGTKLTDITDVDLSIPDVFGYEDGKWYLNGLEIDTNDIVIKSSITLVTAYTAKQIDVVYYKSDIEDITYTDTITYNEDFTLKNQSVKSEFVVEDKQLSKWTIVNGTEVGAVDTALTMNLDYFKTLLGMSETDVKALFEDNDGILTLNLYAVYATLYSLTFADNDETFAYVGQNKTVLSYIEGKTINLVEIVKKYITSITPSAGYVYNKEWQVVGEDKQFSLDDTTFNYVISSNVSIIPIIEKQTYSTKFYVVYSDNSEGVLEGSFKDITVQLDDTITLPTLSDVQSILTHNGVSYRALKWYLGSNNYELGASITITSDLLSSTTLSFRLEALQLRTFTYYAGKAGIDWQSIVGATGDVITVGDINGTPFNDFKQNPNYTEYISAWNIGGTEYAYDDEYTITNDTPSAFYAVWSAKVVNVIYHQNASADDTTIVEEEHNFNSTFQVKNQTQTGFEKSMYRITGWSVNADGSGTTYNLTDSINVTNIDDINLYAIWTRVYNVIYSDTESGKSYTSSDLMYVGQGYTLEDSLSSVFEKEGHYIAKWAYNGTQFNLSQVVTADDLGNPEGESITFTVVWGADSLTVTIKYTDTENNIYGTPKEIETTWGATLPKTDDIKFNSTRQSIADLNDIEYRFRHFVDQFGTVYTVGEDGYIIIGTITKNLVLTTVYGKVLKLSYDLSSIGKSNIVLEYGDGDIVGASSNPLLTSADARIGEIASAVLVGWNDGTLDYRIALNPTDSGYNYSSSWTESFVINTNITLTPVLANKYTLTIYKDLTSTGAFDEMTKETVTLVQGDIIAREFDSTRYKGFVRNSIGYTYNPDADCTYQNNFSFVLSSDIASAYVSTKTIGLYPVKYVYITFRITELKYEKAFKYTAGENITTLPEEVKLKAVDQDRVYFDSWENTSTYTPVIFDNSATNNKYYEDITISAIYRNFYSIQYKLLGSNQYDIYKIKIGETNTLLTQTVAESVYVSEGKTLVGFTVCYTENNILGDHYKENGSTKVFSFGESITASDAKFANNKDLLIFPVYKPALVNITFGLGSAESDVFSMTNAGDYIVETGASYTIEKTDDSISITFNNITDIDTRTSEEVTVTVTVDRSVKNYTLTAFKFGDNDITISGNFEYSENTINITFAYSANSVSLSVAVKYNNDIQDNTNYGYFKVSDNTSRYSETISGDGSVSVVLTAYSTTTSTYITRFVGWFNSNTNTQITTTSGVFAVSGENGEILTITNMVESNSVYAKFVSGYVVVKQKTEVYDYRDANKLTFDHTLSAVYTNVATIGGEEYTGSLIALTDEIELAINPASTITITYTLNTSANWTLWGVQIGSNKVKLGSDGKISYTIGTDSVDIVLLVVPVNVTVVFEGYNGANLGSDYTKTYPYNSTINLNDIAIPSDVKNGIEPSHTFVSWNYENTPLTDDLTTITSNWESLYKVEIIDTKDSSKSSTAYVVYRTASSDATSKNGTYKNYFTLSSVDVQNFKLLNYTIDYTYDGVARTQKSISTDIKKIYYNDLILNYLDNSIVNNDYAKVSDVVVRTVYTRTYTITETESTTTSKTYLSNPVQQNITDYDKFTLQNASEEGYTFKGWMFSYVNGDDTTINSAILKFDTSYSLNDIFGNTLNDDLCPSSVVTVSAVFEINTYTLSFTIPNAYKDYGTLSSTSTYTLNWNTAISFETVEDGKIGRASFVTADGNSVVINATAINGNMFAGFYDSENVTGASLSTYTFKSNTTIYCKFMTNPVTVTANLTYMAGSETTNTIGGYIVINKSSYSGLTTDNYSTNETFTFKLQAEAGFALGTVTYSMGDNQNQTLSPNANGEYSILLTDDCKVNVVFNAIKTDANISIQNISGLNNTPYIYISKPSAKDINTTASQKFADGLNTTSDTLKFKPETNYYSVNKIAYKVNGGDESIFSLNSARASSDYTYYIDSDGKYVVNYVYASNNIEIIVYLDVKEVEVTLYNVDGTIYKTLDVKYGAKLKYTDIAIDSNFKDTYLFKYDAQGAVVGASTQAEAVGGYHFGAGWRDGTSTTTSAGGEISITGDTSLYPTKVKDHKIVFEALSADSSKIYSTPTPNYVWVNGDNEISLDGFATKYNLSTGYQFDGYKIYLGYNNSPNTTGSTSKGEMIYSHGSYFIWDDNGTATIKISRIDNAFANSTDTDKHVVYFVPILSVVKIDIGFMGTFNNGANGAMTLDGSAVSGNAESVSTTVELECFYKVVRTDSYTLQVKDSSGNIKHTIVYTPSSGCKLSTIKCGTTDMQTGDEVEISTESITFKAIFDNSDASVILEFKVDKNINNANVFTLTVAGGSIYTINYGDSTESLSAMTDKTFNKSFTLTVEGTRLKQFTYTVTITNAQYTCDKPSQTITFTSDNNGQTVGTIYLKQNPYKTISVAKSAPDDLDIYKTQAILYYKVPVRTDGIITSYRDEILYLTTDVKSVDIYAGGSVYITSVCVDAYEVKGIYDSESNGNIAGTYDSTYNKYSLNTAYSTFYVVYDIKTITLSFKVKDINGKYGINTWTYIEKEFSVTDITGLVTALNNLYNKKDDFDLNEYFVTNGFEYKENYSNIMLVKSYYSVGGEDIYSYWNLDGITTTEDEIEYIISAEITANITSATTNAVISVNDSAMGGFTIGSNTEFKCIDYVLYSSTKENGLFINATYKVLKGKSYELLPTITPESKIDDAYKFSGFEYKGSTYANWSDINESADYGITLVFKEIKYEIKVSISVLNGDKTELTNHADVTDDITLTLKATNTIKEILYGDNGVYAILLDRTEVSGDIGAWNIPKYTPADGEWYYWIYVFEDCVDKMYWYEAGNASLIIGTESYDSSIATKEIYNYKDNLSSLDFQFQRFTKQNSLSINDNTILTNAYNLKTVSDKYVLSFNNFTHCENNSGSTLYYKADTLVDLTKLGLINESNEVVSLSDICKYTKLTQGSSYCTFSNFVDDSNNEYMTVFTDYSIESGRSLQNADGTATNTTIKLTKAVTLTVQTIGVYKVQLTLTTRNENDDAILTEYGVQNWNSSAQYIYTDPNAFYGKKIEKDFFITQVNELERAGKLFDAEYYIYKMSSSEPSTSDDAYTSFIIKGDTTLYNVVSINWNQKTIKVSNDTDYNGNQNYPVENRYEATFKRLYDESENILELPSGHITNTLPWLLSYDESAKKWQWTINTALDATERAKWTIDDNHEFVGYLCNLNGVDVVIATSYVYYIHGDEIRYYDSGIYYSNIYDTSLYDYKLYTIKLYSELKLSTEEINALNQITTFEAVYNAGEYATISIPFKTYLIDENGNKILQSDSSAYDYINSRGIEVIMMYDNICGVRVDKIYQDDDFTISNGKITFTTENKMKYGSSVYFHVYHSEWIEADSNQDARWGVSSYDLNRLFSYPTIIYRDWESGSTESDVNIYTSNFYASATDKIFSSGNTTITVNLNAYYYELSIPTNRSVVSKAPYFPSGYYEYVGQPDLTNGNQYLFGRQESTTWIFPKGSKYTITNGDTNTGNRMDGFTTTFEFKFYSPVFESFEKINGISYTNLYPCVSTITFTHKNSQNIAVVRDGISGTLLNTFHDGTGGTKSISGTIDGIKYSTILDLNSYDASVVDGVVSLGGTQLKEYTNLVMYSINDGIGYMYWQKVLYTGTPIKYGETTYATIDGMHSANDIVDWFVDMIKNDTDVSEQINGKTSSITWNENLSSSYWFETNSSYQVIQVDYAYQSDAYTFTINKSSETADGIGFVSSDVTTTSNSTWSENSIDYVTSVTVTSSSITITGNRPANKAVTFEYNSGTGNIDITFSDNHTAKVYVNTTSAVKFSSIDTVIAPNASSTNCNVGIESHKITIKYDVNDVVKISYRTDYASPASIINSFSGIFETESTNIETITAPYDSTDYNKNIIYGVTLFSAKNFFDTINTFAKTTNGYVGAVIDTKYNNNNWKGPSATDTTWYRLRGITTTDSDIYIIEQQKEDELVLVNSYYNASYNQDNTFYISFDEYALYTYDLNTGYISDTLNDNLFEYYSYYSSGSVTWKNGITVNNYVTDLSNIKIRTFGYVASSGIKDTSLKLHGTFATYVMKSTSVDTTNYKIKFNWEQIEYTMALYGPEDNAGTLDDIKSNIKNSIADNYYYVRLSNGSAGYSVATVRSEISNTMDTNNRYAQKYFQIYAFTATNPADATEKGLTYFTTFKHSAAPDTVDNGLYVVYPLYSPQDPYQEGLFTYYSKTGGTIAGWNYSTTSTSAYYKYFGDDFDGMLILPEWRFSGSTAYKVTAINFTDNGNDYLKYVSSSPNPSNISYVYISRYIDTITSLDYNATSSLDSTGFYGSHDGIINSTSSPSITRLTWSMYKSNMFSAYIVDEKNTKFKSTGTSVSSLSDRAIGYLIDEEGGHLYHYPSNLTVSSFNGNMFKVIDPFAFAYAKASVSENTFSEVTHIGSCAWYGATTFATTIKLTSTNLEYVGYQLIDARNTDVDIWFYNNIPFIDNYDDGIYTYNGTTHALHGTALLATYDKTWTSGNITIHYSMDYDIDNNSRGLRGDESAHYLCFVETRVDDYKYGRLIFSPMLSYEDAFYVNNGIIIGININNVTALSGKTHITLPTSITKNNTTKNITGVNYLGLVNSSGVKVFQKSILVKLTEVIIPASYTTVGSILNTTIYSDSKKTTYDDPGVKIIRIAVGEGAANWNSIGDGTYGAFGGAFGVQEIYFPNVDTINAVSGTNYYSNNTTELQITLKESTNEGEGVTINAYGFAGLTNLTRLNGNISGLGSYALKDCKNLTSLTYGVYNGITGLSSFGDYMCSGSGLTSINLNSAANYKDQKYTQENFYKLFSGMTALKEVLLDGESTTTFSKYYEGAYSIWTRDGILYGYGTGRYDSYLLHVPRALDLENKQYKIYMRGESDSWGADKIATYALAGNGNKEVYLYIATGDLEGIGEYAFRNSKIETITLASYVGGADANYLSAFVYATNLKRIIITGNTDGSGSNNYTSINGCMWRVAESKYLYYVPENWGADNADGGETFTITITGSAVQSIGNIDNNLKKTGQQAFYRNKNIKYVLISDSNGKFDGRNINYHILSVSSNFDYVAVNDAIVYQCFSVTRKTESPAIEIDPQDVWTDGTYTYYSYGSSQYVLNGSTWSTKAWSGLTSFDGRYIWSSGNTIYYSHGTSHYVLSGNDTWVKKTWEKGDGIKSTYIEGDNIWSSMTDTYYSYGTNDYQYVLNGDTWELKSWSGFTGINGKYVWSDGTNYYYSNGSVQYVLNGSTWSTKTWSGLTSFYADYIWTDGQCIYYQNDSTNGNNYVLDTVTSTWRPTYRNTSDKTSYITTLSGATMWTDGTYIYASTGTTRYTVCEVRNTPLKGQTESKLTSWVQILGSNIIMADYIWTDGTNTYYSYGKDQYVLNGDTWELKSWSGLTSFYGWRSWTDGTNMYYYDGSEHYVLSGSTWSTKTWSGLSSDMAYAFDVSCVWTDGTYTYYSSGSNQYVLSGSTWLSKKWTGLTSFDGDGVWTDGTKYYYSRGTNQYVLNGSTWSTKTWSGLTSFYADYIWTDGTKMYYSSGSSQYVLNGSTWSTKTWSGITTGNVGAMFIWTDGTKTYYSSYSENYVLSNGTWVAKEWCGPLSYNREHIWTDGTNMYYSYGTVQLVLKKNVWSTKTWSGLTSFYGEHVWTDGKNIYYSYGTSQYVLSGSTWSTKTWSGLTSFSGQHIWTDGTNMYYSYGTSQYVLNGSVWSTKAWSGLTSFDGQYIWTNGTNMYYSYNSTHYVLSYGLWKSKTWSGLSEFNGQYIWTDGENTYYSAAYHYILSGSTWTEKTWKGYKNFTGYGIVMVGSDLYHSSSYGTYAFKLMHANVRRQMFYFPQN